MRVQVSDEAIDDLLEISDQLSNRSRSLALDFVAAYERVLEQLRDFPESGQRSRRNRNMRILRSGDFRFMYRVLADRVVLSEILDGRRQSELP